MEIINIIHFFIELCLLGAIFVVATKALKKQKDDPRISSALQLLQSKIAVLEDLSDRTDQQVTQLIRLMDAKSKEVQQKVGLAEKHIELIKQSMDKSLEVAKIFEDKIPHEEIIDRQTTYEYVKAARLAHQGLSIDEIAKQVSIPRGELEILSKVNRDQLIFNDDNVPDWAIQRFKKEESEYIKQLENVNEQVQSESAGQNLNPQIFDSPSVDEVALNELSEQFKEACQKFSDEHSPVNSPQKQSDISDRVKNLTGEITESLSQFLRSERAPLDFEDTAVAKTEELLPLPEELDLDALKASKVAQADINLAGDQQGKVESVPVPQAQNPVPPSKTKDKEPLIRKVKFPTIDMK